MDAERLGRTMTDTAIDREIQAALSVEPSREFLARVRTRIATEPEAAAPWLSWKLVATGAVAALIVIAFVMRLGEQSFNARPELSASPLILSSSKDVPLARDRPVVSLILSPSKDEQSAPAASRARVAAAAPREPEVLIDPAETRALRRLIAGTRDGSLDLSAALRATTPTAMDLPPIDALAIAPLTIDPLTPSGEEGYRQ